MRAKRQDKTPESPVMTERDAAVYLTLSVSMLHKMRYRGKGPTFLQLGRAIRYHRDDLDVWLDSVRMVPDHAKEA